MSILQQRAFVVTNSLFGTSPVSFTKEFPTFDQKCTTLLALFQKMLGKKIKIDEGKQEKMQYTHTDIHVMFIPCKLSATSRWQPSVEWCRNRGLH